MGTIRRLFRGQVAKGATGTLGLQVIEAAAGFATSVVLARALGADGFGSYSFAIALAGLLTIAAVLGHNTLAVREVAARVALHQWGQLRAFVMTTLGRVALVSLLLAATGSTVLLLFATGLEPGLRSAALAGMALVPVIALLRLFEGFLRGNGRVVLALFPDKAFRPILFLALGVATVLLRPEALRSGTDAVLLNLLATFTGLLLLLALWTRYRPRGVLTEASDPAGAPAWRQALPFALIAGVSIVNTQADIIMLGILTSAEEVGVYRVASRVATLVAFALAAVGAAVGPRISALHATGEVARIQELASKAALATTAVALPAATVLIAGAPWILLIFGEDFQGGAAALAILSLGQLIHAIMGVVGLLLSMTGHERLVAKTLSVTAGVNVALNLALIPYFGALGAAVATSVTYLLWNATLAFWVWRVLGLNPTVFGAIVLMWRTR